MNAVHAHLKTLSVLLVFVLALTVFERAETIAHFLESEQAVAAAVNPVSSFLGISNTEPEPLDTNSQVQTKQTTLLGSIRALLSGTPTTTGIGSTPVTSASNAGAPTLVCVPTTANGDEQTIIMWACGNGATESRGTNFATEGDTIGALRVTATTTTTYSIACPSGAGTTESTAVSSCTVRVAQPDISIQANTPTVSSGETATIVWSASGVRSCELRSSYDSTFIRSGMVGNVVSHRLYEDTTFSILCEAATGLLETKTVTVRVL